MESISALQDAMQRELAWRKVEISNLRTSIHKADDHEDHILRASQVLLCSHWEGFLKKAAKNYAEHALSQKVKLIDLAPEIIAFSLFNFTSKAALSHYPGSSEHHVKLAQQIALKINQYPSPRNCWDVNTEGNPGSEVLERILKSIKVDTKLGMDEATWSTTKFFINDHLVKDRNSIAHGGGLKIAKIDLLQRTERTLNLLDRLNETLIKSAIERCYMGSCQKPANLSLSPPETT